MKYTLTAQDEFGGSSTTREFTVDYLPDVLSEIEMFLRGAGFFFNGNLDFVNDFDETSSVDEWTHTLREDAIAEGGNFHSSHYFDTERNK